MVDILEESTVFHKLSNNRGKKPMKFTFPPESKPLEGYTIKRAVGRGGFGEVYYALSDAGKEVALKLLLHNMDVELRGVSQCLNLKHPNLVTIFDIREDQDGDHWIIMEYVSGKSLVDVLDQQNGPLPLEQVQYWLKGIVAGLSFLHDRGIVHRDLKPANVYNENEIVKIGDIGLAKYISQSRRNAQTESVGTVYYMAPEVARGQYGHEVDIYSLGIVLYEMLTGKLPFDGESTGEILMKHLTEKPDLSSVPEQFRSVVSRALEKDPQKRIPSMTQLGQEFQLAIDGKQATVEIPAAEETLENRFEQPENKSDPVAANGIPTEGIPKLKHHAKEIGKEAEKYARKYSKEAQDYAQKLAKNAQDFAEKQKQVHDDWKNNQPKQDPSPQHRKKRSYTSEPNGSGSKNKTALKPAIFIILAILLVGSAVGIRPAQHMLSASLIICFYGGIAYGAYLLAATIFGWNSKPEVNDDFLFPNLPYELPPQKGFKTEVNLESPNRKQYKNKCFARGKRKYVYYGPDTLRKSSAVQKTNTILRTMISSVIIASVMSGCLYFTDFLSGQVSVALAFGITTLLASWAIMIPAKIWEGNEVDSTSKRMVQMFLGGIVGGIAYYLHAFLQIAYQSDNNIGFFRNRDLQSMGLFQNDAPTLIAYILFFASLFFIQRWWLQADSFRKKRFRIRTVLGTLFFAFFASGFIMSTNEYPLVMMAAVSCIIQLSSQWVPRNQREGIVNNSQPEHVA
jgi:eukaryotic-like serine/threonine-protein kinase